MSDDPSFQDLIRRVRAGEQSAAVELVRQYEPEIRRVVRIRLQDPQMQRVFDTMDICQSVLGNFFARVAVGQFELENPEQLLKLLVRMAKNKVIDKARQLRADRRDHRRQIAGDSGTLAALAGPEGTPSQVVAGREIIEGIQRLLSPDNRYLAEQRALGREWADLARELNANADALRKKLSRAIDAAAQQLGFGPPAPDNEAGS